MWYNDIMRELVKKIDEHFEYCGHETDGEILVLRVKSDRDAVRCPYCGRESSRVHSTYTRTIQELPTMGSMTRVELQRRKMFCDNPECSHKTFAEPFDCIKPYARKTIRLQDVILMEVTDTSTVSAAKKLSRNICPIGAQTISDLRKKKR